MAALKPAPTIKHKEKWVSHVPAWGDATKEQRELLDATWRAGELSFLLTPTQLDTYKKIRQWERKGGDRVFCVDMSRRIGKSVLLTTIAQEDALRYPNFRIVYCAPTLEQVEKILLPLMAMQLSSCPPELHPELIRSKNMFVFGNGSRIEFIGLDVRPDGARGTGVDKVLLDEAAFFDKLEYLLLSIIYPQMLGRDWARVIAASTPPVTPMHYWSATLVPEAIKAGAHDRKTLDDAVQYSPEEIEAEWARMPGGRNGITARREYGAEHIADDTLMIVPEFRDAEATCVRVVDPPLWRDCYVSLDPGFHDLSAALFGYWWFEERTLVIEDEVVAARLNSRMLAQEIKATEKRLWGSVRRRGSNGSWEVKPQPYLRISDNDLRLLADLSNDHGLVFMPTQKDNLVAQVDQIRQAFSQGKIIIHPRCTKTILHLKMGVWKKVGSLFDRSGGDLGHFDTIAALVYLWRNVQKSRNPLPPMDRFVAGDLQLKRKGPGPNSRWAQPANDNGIPTGGSRWQRRGNHYSIKTGKV